MHAAILNWLGDEGAIDWSRAGVDSSSVWAKRVGEETSRNPVDRGKRGSKYHLVVDRNGIPLAVRLSAANVHDSKLLEPLVDAIPAIVGPRGRPGRPRFRPSKLHADKAYDSAEKRRRSGGAASFRASRGVAWTPASDSGGTAGSSSARWPGC